MALSEAQLAQRKFSLGASDAAAFCGVSPYRTAADVWSDKVNGKKPSDQRLEDLAYWGDAIEPVIRRWYNNESMNVPHGDAFTKEVGTLTHKKNKWATASPDGLVVSDGDHVPLWGVEIKNRGHNDKPRWVDHVPCEVAAQCYWGMYVTDLSRWDAVALLNGNTPVVQRLERDDELIRAMVVVGEVVWASVQDSSNGAPDLSWVEHEMGLIRSRLVNDADEAAFKRAAYWRKREGK